MNQQHDNPQDHDSPSAAEHAPLPAESARVRALSSARRRRLIQLGAGSVPVALTLASRPVFAAGQCNTTSAWGSAILRGGVASVQARATSSQVSNAAWSISQLVNDTGEVGAGDGGQPWHFIYGKRYPSAPVGTSTKSQYAQAKLKVADLFPGGLSGYSGSPAKVFAYLQANASKSNFVTCMLVARINSLYASAGVAQCLSNQSNQDVLTQMASGSFTPSNGTGSAWSSDDIMRYLTQNNLVRS